MKVKKGAVGPVIQAPAHPGRYAWASSHLPYGVRMEYRDAPDAPWIPLEAGQKSPSGAEVRLAGCVTIPGTYRGTLNAEP